MKRTVFFFILLLIPIPLYCQFFYSNPSSSDFFNSGVVLGTERERHFSMRMEALGRDFSGFVKDQITDLYRNPVFFSKMKNPIFFGEVVRRVPASGWSSLPVRNLSSGTTSTTGIRLGYGKTFGLLLRGNYLNRPSNFSSNMPGGFYTFDNTVDTKNREIWTEAQIAMGFPLSEKLSCGVSYTFGMSEILDSYERTSNRCGNHLSFSNYDSTYDARQSLRENYQKGKSHITRVGLLWNKAKGISWDFVATVELFSANISIEDNYQHIRDYTYRSINSSIFSSTSENFSLNKGLVSVDIEATNLHFDLHFLNSSNEMKTFAVQFGARVSSFSSDDRDDSFRYSESFHESSSDTSKNILSLSSNSVALPDGFGFQINGGTGWTFQLDDFLLAAAVLGNFRYLNYEYDVHRQISDTSTTITPDTTITLKAYQDARSIHHDHKVTLYRIALPLGVEYQLIKNLCLRAGWVVQFLGSINKETSTEKSSRVISNRLDYSTATFGIGYRISDKFIADLLNLGEIGRPRDWNLSLIFSF